jgi:hypothetical protein
MNNTDAPAPTEWQDDTPGERRSDPGACELDVLATTFDEFVAMVMASVVSDERVGQS